MSSIGDLSKFVEPVSKLIDAVRATVGVWYEPHQIRRIAQAEADAALIKAEGEASIDAFERRVQARVAATDARRQRNIEAIVGGAVKALPSAVSSTPVDPDWVAEFFNQSQDVGNETMQSLWSRILAGEVASPGSYGLRTLHAVRMLTKEDAELFAHACRFVVQIGDNSPPLVFDNREYFIGHGLGPSQFLHLEALGLMSAGLSAKPQKDTPIELSYAGKRYEIRDKVGGGPLKLGLSITTYTHVGFELFPLVQAEPVSDCIDGLKKKAESHGFELVEV